MSLLPATWRRARTVLNPLAYEDIRDHGAVCDGTGDDSAAIQAAIDTGKRALIPVDAVCRVSTGLTVLERQSLVSQGGVLLANNITGSVITMGDGSDFTVAPTIDGIVIKGTATRGVDLNGAVQFHVADITLSDGYLLGHFTDGFRTKRSFNGTFRDLSTDGAYISNAHFLFGGDLNAVTGLRLYTGGGPLIGQYAFLFDSSDNGGTGVGGGSNFATLTAQSTRYGICFRKMSSITVDGFYSEGVVHPIVFGDFAAVSPARNCYVNGALIYGPISTQANYSERKAVVDFNYAQDCGVHGVDLEGCSGIGVIAPLAFSGGGGSGAIATARVTAAGAVHSVEVLYGGTGYTSDPTCAIDGAYAGAGVGATFTVTRSGTTVGTVAVNAAGSGYVPAGFPMIATYRHASRARLSAGHLYSGISPSNFTHYSPLYPWVGRDASATAYSGMFIPDDYSWRQGQNGQLATLRKAYGNDLHVLHEYSNVGADVVYVYTPPVY